MKKTDSINMEDLLIFLPDFVRLGEFKQDFCNALEIYNDDIVSLKAQMLEIKQSADSLAVDLRELKQGYFY